MQTLFAKLFFIREQSWKTYAFELFKTDLYYNIQNSSLQRRLVTAFPKSGVFVRMEVKKIKKTEFREWEKEGYLPA